MNYSEIKLNDVYSGKIYRIENKLHRLLKELEEAEEIEADKE